MGDVVVDLLHGFEQVLNPVQHLVEGLAQGRDLLELPLDPHTPVV